MPVLVTEHQKSMVGQSLMYMQHRNMVCGEFHICHYLDLDQNVYDDAYPIPLIHEALVGNHILVILGISYYHNKFSHICVQHHHYPEHDNICLSIFIYRIFFLFPLINDSIFTNHHYLYVFFIL